MQPIDFLRLRPICDRLKIEQGFISYLIDEQKKFLAICREEYLLSPEGKREERTLQILEEEEPRLERVIEELLTLTSQEHYNQITPALLH